MRLLVVFLALAPACVAPGSRALVEDTDSGHALGADPQKESAPVTVVTDKATARLLRHVQFDRLEGRGRRALWLLVFVDG